MSKLEYLSLEARTVLSIEPISTGLERPIGGAGPVSLERNHSPVSCYDHTVTAPHEDPKTFRTAYLETIYHVEHAGERVAFRLAEAPTGARVFAGRRFTLITAANPRSTVLPDTDNAARNAEMRAEFERLYLEFGPSAGTNAGLTWREEGFVVLDAPLATLLEIGRRFEQNAVVVGEGDRVALAWCDTGELEWRWPQPTG